MLGAAYMLWLAKRVIFGEIKNTNIKNLKDVNISELSVLGLLALATIVFGFYPEILLDSISVSVNELINNYHSDINNKIATSK